MAAPDSLNVTQFSGPEGNIYTSPKGKQYEMQHVSTTATRAVPVGAKRDVGRLSAFSGAEPEQHTIHGVNVKPAHQRQGLATAMLDYQRKQQPDLHHSNVLTASGKQFAEASPREWQPKLTAGDYPGSIHDKSTADWHQYTSFTKKNQQSTQRWKNEQADEAQAKKTAAYNAEHHEQLRLFP